MSRVQDNRGIISGLQPHNMSMQDRILFQMRWYVFFYRDHDELTLGTEGFLVAEWDTKRSKCTRVPSCEMWDENMLYAEEGRQCELPHRGEPQPLGNVGRDFPWARQPRPQVRPLPPLPKPRKLDWITELGPGAWSSFLLLYRRSQIRVVRTTDSHVCSIGNPALS